MQNFAAWKTNGLKFEETDSIARSIFDAINNIGRTVRNLKTVASRQFFCFK